MDLFHWIETTDNVSCLILTWFWGVVLQNQLYQQKEIYFTCLIHNV